MREVYFNFIETQEKKMARMKHTMKKRTVTEDCEPVKMPKVPKEVKGKWSLPSGKKHKLWHFYPGTKAVLEIH